MKKYLITTNVILLLVLAISIMFLVRNELLYNEKHQIEQLKSIVKIPYSLALSYEGMVRNNPLLDRNKIQDEFISTVTEMRYGQNNFFLILDGSGIVKDHPLRPELTWWNLLNEIDSDGNYLFKEMIQNSRRDSDVFMKTRWESKFSPELIEEQYIYGIYFWPWDWLFCGIIYESDIETFWNVSVAQYAIFAALVLIICNVLMVIVFERLRK